MRKGQKMPEHVRQQIIVRMKGNNYGAGKGRVLSEETKKKVSEGLKKAWAEGRIRPRPKIFTAEQQSEKRKLYCRRRYAENRERLLAEQRAWREAHPERKKQISGRYIERHRDQLNAKQRAKNKTPERKEYIREYARKHRADNPEMYTAYSENRRARKLAAAGSHTEAEWQASLAAFDGCCAYCGRDGQMTQDHDVPLARGGSNYIDNIVPACGSCNSAKGTLTGEEFRQRTMHVDERWAAQLADARQSRKGKQAA